MRKDYIVDLQVKEPEIDFVERFWTQVWEQSGGVESRAPRFSGPVDRWKFKSEWRVMQHYLQHLPNTRLLDAGCGIGEWTRHLTNQGYPTIGIDISRATVTKLVDLFPDQEFIVGDIRNTGLAAGSFGGIFSWGTFEHFENGLQPCIQESFRLLAPGGLLFITVPFDNFGLAIKALWERPHPSGPVEQLRFYQWRFSRRELATELSIGGFEVLKLLPIHRRQGIVRFLNYLTSVSTEAAATRVIGLTLGLLTPRSLSAHMLMAVARKPEPVRR